MANICAFLSTANAVRRRDNDDRDVDSPSVEDLKRQVILRIKAPLVTLIASSLNELSYVLFQYADQLTDACPGIFDDEYQQFYMQYSDPTHIQHSNIRILAKLANPQSAPDIVSELSELVATVDNAMGRIAVTRSDVAICSRV